MSKKKYLLPIITGVVLVIILGIILNGIFYTSLRVHLPKSPEYSQLPKPMVKQIKAANRSARKNPNSKNLGNLGMVYHSNNFYEKAKESYLLAIGIAPNYWKWNYYLGYLYSELGESENVIKYFSKVLELNPNVSYASYYLGEAYFNNGNNEQAEKIFNKLAFSKEADFKSNGNTKSNLFPLSLYAQFSLARLYIATSRRDKAEEVLQTLTNDHPEFGPGFRLLSTVYADLGKEELSKANIVRANELIPFTAPLDTLIDRLALISQSSEYLMKYIDINSKSNPLWAKKLFEHAIVSMPDNRNILSKGIMLYLNYGFEENLVQYLNKHLQVFANDFAELRSVANMSFDKGKYKLAAIYLEKCIKFDPQNANIRSRLSTCYWEIGKTQESINLIEELLKEKPDSLQVLDFAALRFIMMKEKNKAMDVIQNMENIFKNNPLIFKLKAMNALIEGKYKLADNYYLIAFKDMPQEKDIIVYLGKRYIEQKLWKKSIDHFKSALAYYPNEPFFLQQLADLYLHCPETKLRDLKQAKYYSERVFCGMKSPSLTRFNAGKNLTEIYCREKNWEKASTIYNMTMTGARFYNIPDKEIRDMQEGYKLMQKNIN